MLGWNTQLPCLFSFYFALTLLLPMIKNACVRLCIFRFWWWACSLPFCVCTYIKNNYFPVLSPLSSRRWCVVVVLLLLLQLLLLLLLFFCFCDVTTAANTFCFFCFALLFLPACMRRFERCTCVLLQPFMNTMAGLLPSYGALFFSFIFELAKNS